MRQSVDFPQARLSYQGSVGPLTAPSIGEVRRVPVPVPVLCHLIITVLA